MNSGLSEYFIGLAREARAASRQISRSTSAQKSEALRLVVEEIDAGRSSILVANEKDMEAAKDANLEGPLLDRLSLDLKAVDKMIEGIIQIDNLTDPVGEITDLSYLPSGIQVGKMRVALGVIAIIYESRPNVTVDAAALCLKSGNSCILRGGSEALNSNLALSSCIQRGLVRSAFPQRAVQVVEKKDREGVSEMLKLSDFIDVVIPRGGKGLIERVSRDSSIPVIKHLDGVCHVYVDDLADLETAKAIAFNSKAEKFGVCNAMETLLVHEAISNEVLGKLCPLFKEAGIEMVGCDKAVKIFGMDLARESDWSEEYLGPKLSIGVMESLDAAIAHINHYGSHHTDAIVTNHLPSAQKFLAEVDSASVMLNASTQFADGFEYGLGAEIGISTDKLHARGPVGLEGLTSQKYVVYGSGEIRER
jgi:glutamate-5-semialdehyde dehydrogenase